MRGQLLFCLAHLRADSWQLLQLPEQNLPFSEVVLYAYAADRTPIRALRTPKDLVLVLGEYKLESCRRLPIHLVRAKPPISISPYRTALM